jgi:hypothetical protein
MGAMLLERLNGTIRQHVVPLHRKTRSFAKRRTALDTQTQLFKSHYNLCRKHGALKGKTPAQAAGLTNHPWTLRELLTYNAVITSKISEGVPHIIERRCDDMAPIVLSAREPGKASDLPGGTARYCQRL